MFASGLLANPLVSLLRAVSNPTSIVYREPSEKLQRMLTFLTLMIINLCKTSVVCLIIKLRVFFEHLASFLVVNLYLTSCKVN